MSVETGRLAPDAVRTMFDRISPVYDAMNRTMTLGLDQRWRRATAQAAVRPGDRVLDACCGTGDLAVAAKAAGGTVTGLDFSERMLERARGKSGEIEWVQGDALALPFDDAAFDAATVGFGARNLDDLERGLAELRRVLGRAGDWRSSRSRGRAACSRRSTGSGSTGSCRCSGASFRAARPIRISPRACAGSRAGGAGELLRSAGFDEVRWRLFAGGIVALHTGEAAA